ncbi:hypothetical protein CBFG_02136 [Clostridiales bacterium 1_7_47FAA]|nr:hypothetical protein CBFG_02136 [Clostridiales bacterium 1_7_47FAA]
MWNCFGNLRYQASLSLKTSEYPKSIPLHHVIKYISIQIMEPDPARAYLEKNCG